MPFDYQASMLARLLTVTLPPYAFSLLVFVLAPKTVERLKRKELRNMSESLENMALYFIDQLNRG